MLNPSFLAGAALVAATVACARPAATPQPAPADATLDLVVAATTDVHGRIRGWDYYANSPDSARGLSRAYTIVDSLRRAHPGRVVLVDAGDLFQGNPFAYVAARIDTLSPHPIMGAMRVMSYDAAVVGNHEFNYGLERFERAAAQAGFPFLAANAWRPSGQRAFPAYTMVTRGSVRIAIVGGTTPGSMVWDRDNLRGRLEVRDIVPDVAAAVREARTAGADVVLVGLHSGLGGESSYDTATTGVAAENVTARVAREVPGIDLLFFGHSHREVADTVIGGTHLMQPRNWAGSVAVATLSLVREGGRWRVASKRSEVVRTAGRAEHPAVVAAVEAAHQRTVAFTTTPIGTTTTAWRSDSARVRDTPIVDLILEVQRRAANAQLSSTAAFSTTTRLGPGNVTVADVSALYPYDNTLRAIRISGRQLRDYLEHSARYFAAPGGAAVVDQSVPGYNFDVVSGVDYTLDISRPIGQRVTRLLREGRPVADTDSFTLALNNYRQGGGGGYAMLAGAPVVHDEQLDIRQLVIDEVRRRGTLRVEDYHRANWTLEPAALAERAYAEMNRGASGAQRATGATAVSGRRLRILAINDFHGGLEPRPDGNGVRRGGAAHLATAIRRARAECAPPECESILLDGGDEFQGTPASNLAFGRPVTEVFHEIGLAAGALGNHEFDWGQDTLRARMRDARYAILGANARDDAGRDVPWIRNDTIVQRGALRIGVIGISTVETKRTTRASATVGLQFVDPVPVIDSIAPALRARGADVVVVIAHAGAFCSRDGASDCSGEIVDVARRVRAKVDVIVSGHTHSLVRAVVNGTPIVQARSRGTALGVLDLPLGDGAGRAPAIAVRDILPDSLPADTAVARIVERATAAIAPLVSRRIATMAAPVPRGDSDSPMGNLIADAMRVQGRGDVAFMNNGGVRAGLQAGVVTYGDLFEVQPFANVLYRVTVTGRDLLAYLERRVGRARPDLHVSGAIVRYDSTRAAGQRIVEANVGGRPVDPQARYTVVISDFLLAGGDNAGFGAAALQTAPVNLVDLEALIAYVASRPQPVVPPADRRYVIVPPR